MKQLWLIIFLFVLFSCEQEEELNKRSQNYSYMRPSNYSGGDYAEYSDKFILVEDNQSGNEYKIQKIEKRSFDVTYRAKLIPNELYLKNKGLEGTELEEAIESVADEMLFYFEFEENEKKDILHKYYKNDMESAVSYLSFGITDDFYLVSENGDSLSAAYTNYERNFHVAPFEKVLVCFKGIDPNEAYTLHYNDDLFDKKSYRFSFAPQEIVNHKNNTNQPS